MAMLAGLSELLATGGAPPLLSAEHRNTITRKRDAKCVEETIKKADEKRAKRANKKILLRTGSIQ